MCGVQSVRDAAFLARRRLANEGTKFMFGPKTASRCKSRFQSLSELVLRDSPKFSSDCNLCNLIGKSCERMRERDRETERKIMIERELEEAPRGDMICCLLFCSRSISVSLALPDAPCNLVALSSKVSFLRVQKAFCRRPWRFRVRSL